jgi:chemotaxis protein MotB
MSIHWHRLVPLTLLLSALPACVTKATYDAALDANAHTRGVLDRERAAHARDLASLQAAHAEIQRLASEQARLSREVADLEAIGGKMASSLAVTRAELAAVARARAAAERRAASLREVALKLQHMIDAGDLSVSLRDGRMVLTLPTDVLFDSGQVDIKPRGRAGLAQIAVVLRSLQSRQLQVAGHTDNVPISTARFPSNWELSTARGVEVVRFLLRQGVAPEQLSAAGYGEHDPVATNESPDGRTRNRRIEITLMPQIDELVSVPQLHKGG